MEISLSSKLIYYYAFSNVFLKPLTLIKLDFLEMHTNINTLIMKYSSPCANTDQGQNSEFARSSALAIRLQRSKSRAQVAVCKILKSHPPPCHTVWRFARIKEQRLNLQQQRVTDTQGRLPCGSSEYCLGRQYFREECKLFHLRLDT